MHVLPGKDRCWHIICFAPGKESLPMGTSQTVERVFDRLAMMRDGKFDLSWMHANPTGWHTRATPSVNGLTLTDINVGRYGQVPEYGSAHGSMAPRGAEIPPGTPTLGTYDIDDKAIVWVDNAGELYEEAVARQWSSARDIPWEKLEPLPDDIERAVCQLCTQLTEVEFIACRPSGCGASTTTSTR
jgi:hypothetical protein